MYAILKSNKNMLVVAIIAMVNALGYGIIIPILYSYTQRFGLSDFASGMLFAVFSLCSFLSGPLIGSMSDKYGRKPLLIISLTGTAVSFVVMAMAQSSIVLFLARALDGITAGNIPVLQAVISDSLPPQERAKGFGLVGAAFGFGFVLGPAISAFTVGFAVNLAFIVAAVISTMAILITIFALSETAKRNENAKMGSIVNFKKLGIALLDQKVGKTLLISLLYSFGFALFIFAYQPVSVKLLKLPPTVISANFVVFGLVGLISQAFLISFYIRRFKQKNGLLVAISGVGLAFIGMFVGAYSLVIFEIFSIVLSFFNPFVNPLINSALSRQVDLGSQGEILGLNSSYVSLGNIFGPIVGGYLATIGIAVPFLFGGVVVLSCIYLLKKLSFAGRLENLH